MAPKVYWIQGSPPSRAVMMVATNLNVGIENVTVNLFAKENWTPDFLKKNPAHTVPVLEDGDFIITDSHAILAYLVTVYGKDDSLYPKDPKKRAKVDSMLHFDSSALFVKGKNVVGPIFYQGATTIPEEKINSILESYASVEGFLGKTAWIALDQPTIADYSSITSLLFLDVIAPIDAKKFPKLTAWMKKCADLPSYQTICMPGHNLVKGIIEEKFKALSLS